MLKEVMYYMKRRVDADITLENEDDNLKDYSRSKYLWLSGHDSTIQADILLIVKTFNLNESEIYIYPRYASELTLEIRTDKTEASHLHNPLRTSGCEPCLQGTGQKVFQ